MKKTSIFFAIATIALFSACRKENFNATESTPGAVTVIGVGINDVKTTMGAPVEGTRKIYWANGDVLQANGLTSAALADLPEECTSARFTFDGTLTYPANLLYPADYYKDESTITLPLEQPVTPKVALYGYMDEEGDAQMNALLAYVHIPLTQGEDKDEIKAMIVESLTDGYCLSGDFTIDYETGALTPAAEASKKVSVLFNKPLNPEKATDFFAAVPAGENVKLSVKFKDVKGHCMTKTVTRTFAVGTVTSLPNTEFVPTTTEFDVVITTAAQWNEFAEAFNKGEYSTSTLVEIADNLDFDGVSFTTLSNDGHRFEGIIEGNNNSFQNLQLTNNSIVKRLNPKGVIQNVKIDGNSKLTVNSEAENTYFAPLVADNQGKIENCESAADVEFTAASNTEAWFIGGLAGRSRGGVLKGCTMSGSLIDTEVATAQSYSYIGGITSDVNTFNEKVGKVEDCVFSGKILMGPDAGTTGTGVTGITCNLTTGFRIGGIVGRNQDNAEIIGCSTTSDAEIDIRGDMLVLYVGGIASNAQAPVSECDNYARISIWSKSTDASGGKAFVGGISGLSVAELSGDDNYCAINMNAEHRGARYGGILGHNDGGTLTNCTNNGVIKEDNYRPRYLYIGGVVGDNSGTVTDVHNTESVTVSNVPNNSSYGQTYCGGVIGFNQFDVDGAKIDNSGDVTVNNAKTTYSQIAAGGIAGANTASLSGAKNTGTVTVNCEAAVETTSIFTAIGGVIGAQLDGSAPATVSGCTNEAATVKEGVESVLGKITSSTATTCLNWCEGGIIGYINEAAVTVTGCTNNAFVHHQANIANTAGRNSFTGGIVGKIVAASGKAVTISDCHNYGPCQSQNYNNTMTYKGGPFLGGIAGATAGVSATENVNIENCIVEDKAGATASNVRIYGYRGCTGGIVGYSSFTTVKNCEVSKLMQNNSNATYCGGLVGWANNSSSIVGGTVSSAIGTGKNIGGIVAVMQNSSSVNGSKYAGTITNASVAYGAVAAVSVSGTSITNAKIASTATVMGAAASADNKYVCFDENATISGTAIE